MSKTNNGLLKTLSLILIIVTVATLFVALGYAWFAQGTTSKLAVTGESESYFAGGTGKIIYNEDGTYNRMDPYIIKEPVHLYNLAWLQYMGYFSGEQYCFKIEPAGAVIDMTGWVLPPIGTEADPFIGHFDGNNAIIKNLTIANQLDTNSGDSVVDGISAHPDSIESIDASIVGVFGVIGYPGDIPSGVTYDKTYNAVTSLLLDGVTVETYSDQSLIGILAGYVNGNIASVGVANSSIKLGEDVNPLHDFLGNKFLLNRDESSENKVGVISRYSLIGAYDFENIGWDYIPNGANSWLGNDVGGFGGSIDMYELAQRLTYMYTEVVVKNREDAFSAYFRGKDATDIYTDRADYLYDGGSGAASDQLVTPFLKGSVLPLNVDVDTMFKDEIEYSSGSYVYRTTDYYSKNTSEITADNNTGYLVGDAERKSGAMIRFVTQKLASSKNGGIYKSLSIAENSNATFDPEGDTTNSNVYKSLHLLTYDFQNDTEKYIIDETNASLTTTISQTYTESNQKATVEALRFTQYDYVVGKLKDTLKSGNGLIYALMLRYSIRGQIPYMTTTTIEDAQMSGKTYSTYELIEGVANFNLAGAGYITAVLGTFADSSSTFAVPQIYQVQRNDKGDILYKDDGKLTTSSVIEIKNIYVTYSADGNITNIYYNQESKPDGAVLAYSSDKKITEQSAAYYFEIPVLEGDYIISFPGGSYLLYLDIGTNGDFALGGGGGESTQPKGDIKGVNFVIAPDADGTYPTAAENRTWMDQVTNWDVVVYDFRIDTGHGGGTVKFERVGARAMKHGTSTGFHLYPAPNDFPTNTVAILPQSSSDLLYERRRCYY